MCRGACELRRLCMRPERQPGGGWKVTASCVVSSSSVAQEEQQECRLTIMPRPEAVAAESRGAGTRGFEQSLVL